MPPEKPIQFSDDKGIYTQANRIERFYEQTKTYIIAILIVIILAFVQIVIDSFRFSSVTYREYMNRSEERSVLLSENKQLLEEMRMNQIKILNKIK